MSLRLFYKSNLNKYAQWISILTSFLLLLGCSSTEAPISYYSLNSIETTVTSPTHINHKKRVVIRDIEMANFLKTGSLVMQVGLHQIQLSNQHRWADKLPRAILINLVKTLSGNRQGVLVGTKPLENQTNDIIDIFFEQFTLSTHHAAVISGSYVIHRGNNKYRQYFDIRQPLEQDGYDHAIQQFKKALRELSLRIFNDVTN